ncbi:MAG: penicillin-binding protein 2 [Wenzhouxiangellaceae bacterium]
MISTSHRIRDEHRERLLVLQRLKFCAWLVVALTLLLIWRYSYLQVSQFETYSVRSEKNRIRLQAVPPTRGLIYDRNGEILADNRPAYRLELIPEKVDDMAVTLERLEQLITLSADDLKRFHNRRREGRRFDRIPLSFALSDQEVARVAVNRHHLSGVEVVPYLTRFYPYGSLMAHVTGYVGRLDQNDVPSGEEDNYRGTTHAGHSALERYYEPLLHGTAGWQRIETNAEGRIIKTLERQEPQRGQDLHLTIDLDLQRTAAIALQGAPGAVVAIDPRNGEVLALVSEPGYDPNLFVNGISSVDYRRLLETPGKPLFNRALQGTYEPGSTLKPFIALAAMHAGLASSESRFFSSGRFFLPNSERPFRDYLKGGHGWVDIRQSLEQSVNTTFYQLALDLGIDRIHAALVPFGLGRITGLDLPGEATGLLPSREWKRARYDQPWYPGETVITGIGQGYTLITPVQLAAATAALATGQWHQPHLRQNRLQPLEDTGETAPAEQLSGDEPPLQLTDFQPEHLQVVHEGMAMVIHGVRGTARTIAPKNYRMAGKTGTAQVYTQELDEEYIQEQVAQHLRHHALFIAFAPVEQPRIAVAVVAEHGGFGSSSAAPVAQAVVDAWMKAQP